MKQIETNTHLTDDQERAAYVAPKLTVLDAGKTATGLFDSPTEGTISNLIS